MWQLNLTKSPAHQLLAIRGIKVLANYHVVHFLIGNKCVWTTIRMRPECVKWQSNGEPLSPLDKINEMISTVARKWGLWIIVFRQKVSSREDLLNWFLFDQLFVNM